MLKDDEIKNNSGTSYDFGARMYDPRIGRWLSTDAVSSKKPDLSPFQGFRNNPIIFIDPDGNDEWNSVVLKDQQGNIVAKSFARVSTMNYMSSGTKEVSDGGGGWYTMSNGYDFKNEMTFQVQSDGSIKHMKTETVLIVHNGIKDREYGPFTKKEGEIYSCGISSTGYEQPGGIYMYSKGGQGTKYYSRADVESMDAEDLLTMLGVLGRSDFKNLATNTSNLGDLTDNLKGIAEETGVLPKGGKDPSVQSNETIDSKPTVQADSVTVLEVEKRQSGDIDTLKSTRSRKDADKEYKGTYNKNKTVKTVKKF